MPTASSTAAPRKKTVNILFSLAAREHASSPRRLSRSPTDMEQPWINSKVSNRSKWSVFWTIKRSLLKRKTHSALELGWKWLCREKKQAEVTATMTTIVPVPPSLKRPSSVPLKARAPTAVMDMVVSKPIRHIAVLPSAKEQAKKRLITDPANLSGRTDCSIDLLTRWQCLSIVETFNLYDGPTTTPDLGRSLDDTMTMK